MIKEYTFFNNSELTETERKRFKKFKENHKQEKCHCYYITDFSLGAGYDIIATTIKIESEKDFDKLNNSNMRNITDVDSLLNNF